MADVHTSLDVIYNNSAINHIPLKNSLATSVLKSKGIELVVKEIEAIPDYKLLRNDIELVLRICNIIHELKSNDLIKSNGFKDSNLSEKEIVVQGFKKAFNLNDIEVQNLNNIIDFLISHKKVVGVRFYKKVGLWLYNSVVFLLKRLF